MIDTVRYCQTCRLKDFGEKQQALPKDWAWSESKVRTKPGWFVFTRILQHEPTGLRATFYPKGKTYVQVSLPRLLFGRNSRLITEQNQLERALEKADRLLGQVAAIKSKVRRFTRVDLAWQVKGRIQEFLDAHRNLKHPEIQRLPVIWQGETILWPGREMSISIYDKPKQAKLKARNIVRIEIKLHGNKLRTVLGGGRAVEHLTIPDCYDDKPPTPLTFKAGVKSCRGFCRAPV